MLVHDLPAQPTSFIGRTQELAEILDLLNNADCRLLTLIGPGGIGKTRLALEVASRNQGSALSARASDVVFVPLQPLSSPALIPSALAEAVGLQFYAGSNPEEQLVDYLRPKSFLVILDNFEHLLDGADLVADLLANAPTLKILVTSRETLNLREEWLYQLKGMSFPTDEDAVDAETYSAVRLFVQSARRVRPDFSFDAERQSVLRICQLVEGMPLALEMTAAWLRRLPADEIVQQLERGLDILESPARNIPARHRSIRAVFEHSWNLLTDQEQDAFARLSVFRGGFRREAAEIICGASLTVLSALVDKSLLYLDSSGRYDLHELLRQYGDEKLNLSPNLPQQTRAAHCAYYVDFLTRREFDMMAHMSLGVVAEITAELKNIRLTVDWVLDHNNVGLNRHGLSCLLQYYQFRCLYEEGEETAARFAANLRRNPPSEPLGRMLIMQGWFVQLRSQDYARARALMEEGVKIGESLPHARFYDDALLRLSDLEAQLGNYEQARVLAQQCVDSELKSDEHWSQTFNLAHLGYVLYLLGQYTEAEPYIRDAIRIADRDDVASGLSDARNYLGQIQLAKQAYQDARQNYAENLEYSRHSNYLKGTVLALIGLGDATRALRDYEESRRYLSEALKVAMESNQIPYVLQALTAIAELLLQTNDMERAARLLALVLDDHATNHETRSRAQRQFVQMESQLAADALSALVEQGRSASIDETVRSLLNTDLSSQPDPASAQSGIASPLSEREIEILRLVAEGFSNREIADKLYLAAGTIKWYLSEIYGKLYVTSRTQAIARARDMNLLT